MQPTSIVRTTLALALSAPAAVAGFTNPFTPSWRGAANTEYAAWETFTQPSVAPNLPDDPLSTTVDAQLVQLDTTAFLTGGNIYSFSAPLRCELSDGVAGTAREVVLQVSTRGNELDYAGVHLVYADPSGAPHSVTWTQRTELARTTLPNGAAVETLFRFDLVPLAAAVDAFTLHFDAALASTSLDALILDVRCEPPPSAYCTAKINALGCAPAIAGLGLPSASASSGFVVRATELRNQKPGVLLYSDAGRAAQPFTGGFLCVAGPVKRVSGLASGGTPAPASDCSGVLAVDMNAFRAGALGGNPAAYLSVPGTVIDCQFWSRDPGFPLPNNTQLSDALEFTVLD